VPKGGSQYNFPAEGKDGSVDAVCYESVCDGGRLYLKVLGKMLECPAGEGRPGERKLPLAPLLPAARLLLLLLRCSLPPRQPPPSDRISPGRRPASQARR
jgi:hypothetical protein